VDAAQQACSDSAGRTSARKSQLLEERRRLFLLQLRQPTNCLPTFHGRCTQLHGGITQLGFTLQLELKRRCIGKPAASDE
jgi:hypothetical protein